jgi:hypothetical protein
VQNIWHAERLRYVGHQYPYPFCSLDPQKGAMGSVNLVMRDVEASRLENDAERKRTIQRLAEALGPQQVRVGGVPRDVRLAHVMIDADYHMKKVSQGHLTLSGVQSCSRIGLERQKHPPTFVEASGIVEIENCAMVVLTERQVSALPDSSPSPCTFP